MGKCINCGEEGPHFVPPCCGDPGFFSCKPKEVCRTCGGKKMIESSSSGRAYYNAPSMIPCPTCCVKEVEEPKKMRMKDVKPPPNHGGGVNGDATVGDMMEFLSQFPKSMPLIMQAEPDACREEGYPFFYASGDPFEWTMDIDKQVEPEGPEDEWEVKSVRICVDH